MEQSIGRTTEPTTEAGASDARDIETPVPDAPGFPVPEIDDDIRHRVRDVLPSLLREDTGITDLDELQRAMDPLDPRRPGRPTGDPLDPEGGVI